MDLAQYVIFHANVWDFWQGWLMVRLLEEIQQAVISAMESC